MNPDETCHRFRRCHFGCSQTDAHPAQPLRKLLLLQIARREAPKSPLRNLISPWPLGQEFWFSLTNHLPGGHGRFSCNSQALRGCASHPCFGEVLVAFPWPHLVVAP